MDRPPLLCPLVAHRTETNTVVPTGVAPPSYRAISDCAYALYQRGGRLPGRDLEHWFAASASLRAPSLAPVSTLALPIASSEPPSEFPAPHALGDQAGRAAYTLHVSQAAPIFSPTCPAAP